MTQYPLLFGFNDLIAGKGFFAGVSVSGRGLLVDEGDGFWMYGVNPGGVAAGGKTPAEAQSEFRLVYRSVLFDIASEAMDFHGFKEEVDRFFNDTNKPTLAEWEKAVQEVRRENVEVDWLPKKSAESQIEARVLLVENPVPSVNALDEAKLAA